MFSFPPGPNFRCFLDLSIRQSTRGKKSLDDVMRLLYWKYYRGMGRGVTDAEVQGACESVAGSSLAVVFEYIYSTKEIDYNKYLGIAGLKLEELPQTEGEKPGQKKFMISRMKNSDEEQAALLKSWIGEN